MGYMYTSANKRRDISYANVTKSQIIIHIYSNYGNITAVSLDDNKHRMKSPFDTNQWIEMIYTHLEQVINVSEVAVTPYKPNQIR